MFSDGAVIADELSSLAVKPLLSRPSPWEEDKSDRLEFDMLEFKDALTSEEAKSGELFADSSFCTFLLFLASAVKEELEYEFVINPKTRIAVSAITRVALFCFIKLSSYNNRYYLLGVSF